MRGGFARPDLSLQHALALLVLIALSGCSLFPPAQTPAPIVEAPVGVIAPEGLASETEAASAPEVASAPQPPEAKPAPKKPHLPLVRRRRPPPPPP
ncbi:MAG TPA: PRC-barrel domain containing protein, partial [Paraburkholderia sp.]|nr:PRC-barrel domain containing protein [Paraburkholderia sp.]